MFGPNSYPDYTHRDTIFKDLLWDMIENFMTLANLDRKNDLVIPITGSGTLANEVVISSLKCNVEVITNGEFSDRIRQTSALYNTSSQHPPLKTIVQYETGISQYYHNEIPYDSFTDAISSFPYYTPPNSRIWTTVAFKQLGGHTGLSLIIIRDHKKTICEYFKPECNSYLSLVKYVNKFIDKKETPNTPAITAIESLSKILSTFDLESYKIKINRHRGLFDLFSDNIIGDGPVITFQQLPEDIINKYKIYNNGGYPQLFLWTGDEGEYRDIINTLRTRI